tara:strand:- start:147 stop:812 length:666 start_codon:yes stop_codon:yes gene_type:complete
MLSFKEFYNLNEDELENLQESGPLIRNILKRFGISRGRGIITGPPGPRRPRKPPSSPPNPNDGIDIEGGGGTGLLEPKPGQEPEFDTGSGWDESMAKPNELEVPPGHHENVADSIFGNLPEIFGTLWEAYPELFDQFSALLRMLIRAAGDVDAADAREMIDVLRQMGIDITLSNTPGSPTGIDIFHDNPEIWSEIGDQLGLYLGIADGLLDEIIDLLNSGY